MRERKKEEWGGGEEWRVEGIGGSWRKRDGINGRSGRCKFNPSLRRKSCWGGHGMGGNGAPPAGNSIREFFFNLSPPALEKRALVRSIV